MTDTVRVPREPTKAMIKAASDRAGYTEYGPLIPDGLLPDIYQAMIAAAPQTEPCAEHKALGFHIDPCCPHCTDPEAQKCEPEPVGWMVDVYGSATVVWSRVHAERASQNGCAVMALYTRPAQPNELLKALEPFARYYDLNDCHERSPDDALEVPISDLARAKRVVTEHGGVV